MLSAFCGLENLHQNGWTFICAGHLGTKPKDRNYFDSVKAAAQDLPCELEAGIERSRIHQLYRNSKLFCLRPDLVRMKTDASNV